MRPRSIILFERLYLAAIAIEVVRVAADWSLLLQSSASDRWVRLIAIAVSLSLVLLAARRRRRVAGWILAALFVIGLPIAAELFGPGVAPGTVAAGVAQLLLQAAALVLVFKPDSRAWFDSKGDIAAP